VIAIVVVVLLNGRKKAPKSTSDGHSTMAKNPTYAETSFNSGSAADVYKTPNGDLFLDSEDMDDMYRVMPEGFGGPTTGADPRTPKKADFGLKLSGAGWTSLGDSDRSRNNTYDDIVDLNEDDIGAVSDRGFGDVAARSGDVSFDSGSPIKNSKFSESMRDGGRANWMSTIEADHTIGEASVVDDLEEDNFDDFENDRGFGNASAKVGDISFGDSQSFRKSVKEPELKRLGSVSRARKGPVLSPSTAGSPGSLPPGSNDVDYTKEYSKWETEDFMKAEEELEFGFAASFDA
jgi:hypothetical protein